ncbi:hypothetical protein PM082_010010 [Marasmius tenuissimus]|nr:hypothetical protein PM082_010010 [Marasmius tenuissimus]
MPIWLAIRCLDISRGTKETSPKLVFKTFEEKEKMTRVHFGGSRISRRRIWTNQTSPETAIWTCNNSQRQLDSKARRKAKKQALGVEGRSPGPDSRFFRSGVDVASTSKRPECWLFRESTTQGEHKQPVDTRFP